MTTLLDIVQGVVREVGGTALPASAYGSANRTIDRIINFSNVEGEELVKEFEWTGLQRLHSFATSDGVAEYDLPDDYDRLVNDTEWNRSNAEPLLGPVGLRDWETIKSGLIGSGGVHDRYSIRRSSTSSTRVIHLDPTPSSAETLVLWYISNYWCESASGDGQTAWAADTDVLLLPKRLMVLGTTVRYKRSRGLEYASEAAEYADVLEREKGNDAPARPLSMTPRRSFRLVGTENAPETGLGS